MTHKIINNCCKNNILTSNSNKDQLVTFHSAPNKELIFIYGYKDHLGIYLED